MAGQARWAARGHTLLPLAAQDADAKGCSWADGAGTHAHACRNPEQHVWWDDAHPTSRVHQAAVAQPFNLVLNTHRQRV